MHVHTAKYFVRREEEKTAQKEACTPNYTKCDMKAVEIYHGKRWSQVTRMCLFIYVRVRSAIIITYVRTYVKH